MGLPMARLRCVFSISTVASSTRMPTARARPPSVITLMVSPSTLRMQSEARIESGIEMQTIRVLRQLPRKSRIISAGEAGGDEGFAHHALNGGAHEDGLVGQGGDFQLGRHVGENFREARPSLR